MRWALAIAIILSIINVIVFIIMWGSIRFIPAQDGEQGEFLLTTMSFQMSVLQTIIAVVGIAFAIVAIFGYRNIKDAAIDAAIKAAELHTEKYAPEFLERFMQAKGYKGITTTADNNQNVDPQLGKFDKNAKSSNFKDNIREVNDDDGDNGGA